MKIVRRLQKLESRINPIAAGDPLRSVRINALGDLAPADWRAVPAMPGSYMTGDVENTHELRAVFVRWKEATADLIARNEPLTL